MRQILNHTSGIARDPSNPRANAAGGDDLAELVRSGLTQAPLFAPGTDYSYSKVGYQVLGMLIERLGGTPYPQAIDERIIQPLGLGQTTYPAHGDRSLAEPYLRGYLRGRLGPVFFWLDRTFSLEPSLVGPAGALNTTMPDLATFQVALAMVTDDGRFASLVTNAYVTNATEPTRGEVIDAALCES